MFFEIIDKTQEDSVIFNSRHIYGFEFWNQDIKFRVINLEDMWEAILEETWDEEDYSYIFNNVPAGIIKRLQKIFFESSMQRLNNSIPLLKNKIRLDDFKSSIKNYKGDICRAVEDDDFEELSHRDVAGTIIDLNNVVAIERIEKDKIIIQLYETEEEGYTSFLLTFHNHFAADNFISDTVGPLVEQVLTIPKV